MATLIEIALQFFFQHPFFVPFLSGLIQEEALILTTILSGKGAIPLYALFIFGFLGIIASDIFWFLFIKIKPILVFSKKVGKMREKAFAKTAVRNFPPPTNLKSYIFAKFTYGLRTWAIFYCGVHGMSLKTFIKHTAIATAIWMVVMVTISYYFGKALYLVFELTKSVGTILFIIGVFFILLVLISRFFLNRLKKS